MSGDGVDDVSIPMVFVFYNDAKDILEALKSRPKMEASLLDSSGKYLAQYSSLFSVYLIIEKAYCYSF